MLGHRPCLAAGTGASFLGQGGRLLNAVAAGVTLDGGDGLERLRHRFTYGVGGSGVGDVLLSGSGSGHEFRPDVAEARVQQQGLWRSAFSSGRGGRLVPHR